MQAQLDWLLDGRNAGLIALVSAASGLGAFCLAVLTAIDRWHEGRPVMAILWMVPIVPVAGVFVVMWASGSGRLDLQP